MINHNVTNWISTSADYISISDHLPEFNRPLFILVEDDIIHNPEEYQPYIRKAILIKSQDKLMPYLVLWKLLDYDPESEEEILQQHFQVICWRYVK